MCSDGFAGAYAGHSNNILNCICANPAYSMDVYNSVDTKTGQTVQNGALPTFSYAGSGTSPKGIDETYWSGFYYRFRLCAGGSVTGFKAYFAFKISFTFSGVRCLRGDTTSLRYPRPLNDEDLYTNVPIDRRRSIKPKRPLDSEDEDSQETDKRRRNSTASVEERMSQVRCT